MRRLLVFVAVLITSCSLVTRLDSLRIYERNSSGQVLGIQVHSGLEDSGWGRMGHGGGCVAIGVPWTVSIGPADEDGRAGNYKVVVSSANVAEPTNAEIWIDVAADGSVTWGEGRPAWAREEAPICGSRG